MRTRYCFEYQPYTCGTARNHYGPVKFFAGLDFDPFPYSGKCMGFQTEQEAYEFFMANVGLDAYCDLLLSMLEKFSRSGYTRYVDWLREKTG